MNVSVTSHRDPEPLDLTAFERLGAFALRMEQAPDAAELSIAVVGAEEMTGLNEKYRGADGATDVLSFGCDDPCPADSDEPITLGDVIISPEIAEANASERGVTVESELDLLLVHGILHILGYGHDEAGEAEAMETRERVILDAWADHR
jgi:probable rRNA maturation factor